VTTEMLLTENGFVTAEMQKKLEQNGKILRVKLYLEAKLTRFLPHKLLFI